MGNKKKVKLRPETTSTYSVEEEVDQATRESIVWDLLRAIGEDPDREGLKETPQRVVRSWQELFGGYKQNPLQLLKTFEEHGGCDEIVMLRDVEFVSFCEHHMLPFTGVAHIAYLPRDRIVGVSKLVRLLEVFTRRLQIQERICKQVASSLMQEPLKAQGAACVLEARHMCMSCRGVNKQNSIMVTSSLQGTFKTEAAQRAEFMSLIRG